MCEVRVSVGGKSSCSLWYEGDVGYCKLGPRVLRTTMFWNLDRSDGHEAAFVARMSSSVVKYRPWRILVVGFWLSAMAVQRPHTQPYVDLHVRSRHWQHWCLVPMSWWKKKRQTRNCNAFEKILWFLSFSFDAGTSTKGKYAELLSWLANLCANFFLEENLPLPFHPQICIFSCDHSSLTNIITHHSSLTFQSELILVGSSFNLLSHA